MRYFIRDHSIDLTCTVNELYTMHERSMAIYGMTAYIASWLTVLKQDKRALFTAAGKAQQAVDWLHARQEAHSPADHVVA